MMDTLLLLALNGLIWGLIIALIALGLSIIFGLLDVINIAHGDFFMVGTVLAWFTLEATGNFWLGFLVAPLVGFILGALTQRVVIQPIRGAAALSIVATFGLSLILQESVRIAFGPVPRQSCPPSPGRFRFSALSTMFTAFSPLPFQSQRSLPSSCSCSTPPSAPGCARSDTIGTPQSRWVFRQNASTC